MTIFHGYLVFLATFFLNFITIGQFLASSLYLNPLHQSFPESGSGSLALFFTIQIVAALVSSLAGGIAQDALDSLDIELSWLFFGGGGFMFLGLIWSSYASSLMGVLLGAVSLGLGNGLAGLMSAGICVLWFETSRATMLLLAISGQGLGSIFFPWIIVKLLEAYDDIHDPWRPTMRWMGLLSFVVCAICAYPMRLPFPGEVEENEKETVKSDEMIPLATDLNYGSVGEDSNIDHHHLRRRIRRSSVLAFEKVRTGSIPVSNMRSSIISGVTSGLRRSSVLGAYQALGTASYLNKGDVIRRSTIFAKPGLAPVGDSESSFTLKDVALSRTNLWLGTFTLTVCFAVLNAQVLFPQYCHSLGFPKEVEGFALTLVGMGALIANLTIGVVVDRFGARNLLAFGFATLASLFFAWPFCVTPTQIHVLAFFFGYFQGPFSSLPLLILADAFASSSSEHVLALNGITNMCKFPGYLLGPAVASYIAQNFGSFQNATALSGIIELVSVFMLLMIPSPEEQQRQLAEKKSRS